VSAAEQWRDPRTGEVGADPGPPSSPAEVAATVAAAHAAWLEWRQAGANARAGVLGAIADACDADAAAIAELGDVETALGVPRLTGEVARTTGQLRMFADALTSSSVLAVEVDEAVPGAPPAGRPRLVRTHLPLGVVAVFGASNFPLAFGVLGGDTASALAAGCAVVVKEHPAHPRLSALLVARARAALVSAGAPADLLTSVRGLPAGAALVAEPQIRAVGFTGSLTGGRALFDIAMRRPDPIPFYGELGSVNPVFVTRAAAEARAAAIGTGFVESLTLGAGQFCTKPALLCYPESASGIVEAALTALSAVAPAPLLTPAIAARFTTRVAELAQAGTLLAGGVHDGRPGAWVHPALVGVDSDRYRTGPDLLREECFGPAGLLVAYRDDADALALATAGPGVLVSCLHAEDTDEQSAALAQALAFRSGRIVINGWPTGVAVAPAQMHGGPYPASTSPRDTSVGLAAINRFTRPVVWQSMPGDPSWPPPAEAGWLIRQTGAVLPREQGVSRLASVLIAVILGHLMGLVALAAPAAAGPAAAAPAGDPLHLPVTARARVNGVTLRLEVADDQSEQVRGLMYRPALPDRRGMLFPFSPAQPVSFWMLNVPVPLDMVFLRGGRVLTVLTAQPCQATPCPLYGPGGTPVDGVIELRAGHAAELGITPGARVTITRLR